MNPVDQESATFRDVSSSKIGAIRDIIFGANLEAFNQEVNDIRNTINRYRVELDSNIQQLREQMMIAVQTMEREIEQKLEAIETATIDELKRLEQVHIGKDEFSKLLLELGQRLQRKRSLVSEVYSSSEGQ